MGLIMMMRDWKTMLVELNSMRDFSYQSKVMKFMLGVALLNVHSKEPLPSQGATIESSSYTAWDTSTNTHHPSPYGRENREVSDLWALVK